MLDKLAAIEERYEELGREMARPELAGDYERLQALARDVTAQSYATRRLARSFEDSPTSRRRGVLPARGDRLTTYLTEYFLNCIKIGE